MNHLTYLAEALRVGSVDLFLDYVRWAAGLHISRNIPTGDLVQHLRCLKTVLIEELPPALEAAATAYVREALHVLGTTADPSPEETRHEKALRSLAQAYLAALVDGNPEEAHRLVHAAVDQGTSVRDIYLDVFQWSQHEIGRLWQANRLNVAQEHLATAVTREIMAQLAPLFSASAERGKTFVMACVAEEEHEIGARMVTDFFAFEGWTTYYLGANVPAHDVVEAVKRYEADVLGLSATLTVHLGEVVGLIRAVRRDPACASMSILVGGYPFNIDPDVWQQIGADGYARSADTAVERAEALVSSR